MKMSKHCCDFGSFRNYIGLTYCYEVQLQFSVTDMIADSLHSRDEAYITKRNDDVESLAHD